MSFTLIPSLRSASVETTPIISNNQTPEENLDLLLSEDEFDLHLSESSSEQTEEVPSMQIDEFSLINFLPTDILSLLVEYLEPSELRKLLVVGSKNFHSKCDSFTIRELTSRENNGLSPLTFLSYVLNQPSAIKTLFVSLKHLPRLPSFAILPNLHTLQTKNFDYHKPYSVLEVPPFLSHLVLEGFFSIENFVFPPSLQTLRIRKISIDGFSRLPPTLTRLEVRHIQLQTRGEQEPQESYLNNLPIYLEKLVIPIDSSIGNETTSEIPWSLCSELKSLTILNQSQINPKIIFASFPRSVKHFTFVDEGGDRLQPGDLSFIPPYIESFSTNGGKLLTFNDLDTLPPSVTALSLDQYKLSTESISHLPISLRSLRTSGSQAPLDLSGFTPAINSISLKSMRNWFNQPLNLPPTLTHLRIRVKTAQSIHDLFNHLPSSLNFLTLEGVKSDIQINTAPRLNRLKLAFDILPEIHTALEIINRIPTSIERITLKKDPQYPGLIRTLPSPRIIDSLTPEVLEQLYQRNVTLQLEHHSDFLEIQSRFDHTKVFRFKSRKPL